MATYKLYVLAAICVLVAGFFYKENMHHNSQAVAPVSGIDYNATNLHVTQTNEKGELDAVVTADYLQHFKENDKSMLHQVKATWYKNNQPDTTFASPTGSLEKKGAGPRLMLLTDGVVVSQLPSAHPQPITFTTPSLMGEPDAKTFHTELPTQFSSAQGFFNSTHGLQAN